MKYETGLVGAINTQRPNNKNKKDHEDYNKVLRKLDSLIKDERLSFMMKGWDGAGDPMPSVLAQILGDGAAVRIVDLSGVPNEVGLDPNKLTVDAPVPYVLGDPAGLT